MLPDSKNAQQTNLAIEAYYQNVHLLLRKWMQLQSNLDFNTSKSHTIVFYEILS